MRGLKTLCNYLFYCGIEKDRYNEVKKDAYVSNFVVWRILHSLMIIAFGFLFVGALANEMLRVNRIFYFIAFAYSVIAIIFFFILKKDSLIIQFIIYLSITMLFLFACLITQNKPAFPATTFIVFLLIIPMLIINKPFYMTVELFAVSAAFIIWMHNIKPYDIWIMDFINVIIFTIIGIFLNIIANSIRIKEFVLTREINIQKDIDEMTGLKNKGALTREINEYLLDASTDRGIMFMLDIDRFKLINDTYGHDIGDSVICQVGRFLDARFINNEIVGRFGGDEFIVFIRDSDDLEAARKIAEEIIEGASKTVALPESEEKISLSIGVAVYHGIEMNYSELFKKADIALYKTKADSATRFCIYG